jgi:hypothetical protein
MTALQIAGCFFGCLEDVAVEVRTSNFGLQAQLFVRRQCFDPTWHLAALRWPHAAAHGDSDLAPLRPRQCPSTHWPNSEGPGWCHLCRFWEKHNTIELLTSLSLRAFLKATWWQRHRGTVPVDAGDHTPAFQLGKDRPGAFALTDSNVTGTLSGRTLSLLLKEC